MELRINYIKLKQVIETLMKVIQLPENQQEVVKRFSTMYYKAFAKTLKHNGKEYTLDLFKLTHQQAVALAITQSVQPIPFHKSGKDGVSHYLRLAVPLLLSKDDKVIRLILTITRVYEAIRLSETFDPKPIVSPYSGEVDLEEFCIGLRRYLKRAKWFLKLKKLFLAWPKATNRLRGRIRSGPNGQCNITSHYDAVSIYRNNPELWATLQRFNVKCNQNFINEAMDHCYEESKDFDLGTVRDGKISLASERAGKTRLFAIGDFWSQNSLQALHDNLMRLLRHLPTDCTFDQNKGFFRILKSWGKRKWIGSADLTKFTDRVPIRVCKEVLYCLTDDQEFSDLWELILQNREFWYEEGTYRWLVGGPLGLLSGWAMFSLTHHCLVQYSYFQSMSRWDFFRSYQLLGDDITIWHRVVYKAYASNLKRLGVEINETKSMKSVPGQYRFEFAKRIANNGKEITGFPYDLLHNATKSIYNYTDLVRYLVETKFLKDALSLNIVPDYLSLRGKRFLSILLWEAELLCPAVAGNIGSTTSLGALRRQMLLQRLIHMKSISERLDKVLGSKSLQQYFTAAGVKFSVNLLAETGSNRIHPIIESLNYTGYQLYELLEHLSQLSTSDDLVIQDVYPALKDFEYMPLPHMSPYFERPGRRDPVRAKAHSKLVLQAHYNLRPTLPVIVIPSDIDSKGD